MRNKKLLIVVILLCLVVIIMQQSRFSAEIRASVIETDDEDILSSGISYIGSQKLDVRLEEGEHKGEIVSANNLLMGQSEYDEIYIEKDRILVAIQEKEGEIVDVRTISMDRSIGLEVMIGLMAVLLIIFGRWVGLKALLSFAISILIIWFVLIKGLLQGYSPLLLTTITVIMLSAIIIFLVSGFNRRGISAFIGTISGLMVTLLVTHIFGSMMHLYGMTQPYAQTLIISGHFNLNLLEVFYAAIVLGASGAAMDIAVDISASMYEIKLNHPLIERKKLIQSGLSVGRQVIGTMTTTLLLAYAGSYLTLLMLFMAKETSFIRMMNMKIVVSEVLRTVMGSIGLILVAPLTALIAGILMTSVAKTKDEVIQLESDDIV